MKSPKAKRSVIKGRKRLKGVRDQHPVFKIPDEWAQRWESNYIERAHEFIRTERTDECDRGRAELYRKVKKPNSRPTAESLAQRWGVDPEMFDRSCRFYEGLAPGEGEARAAYDLANGIQRRLMGLALKGDPISIAILTKIAHDATSDVQRVTREHLEKVRELAERAASFPILISPHKDLSGRAYIEEKLRVLNIGRHAAINISGFDIRASQGQPFKQAIHIMCDRLFRVVNESREEPMVSCLRNQPGWRVKATKLPALSEQTSRADAESWFGVGWEALCEATDGRPEHLPLLKGIGDYKERKGVPLKEFSICPTKYSNAQRAGLYERLKAAWLARYAHVK